MQCSVPLHSPVNCCFDAHNGSVNSIECSPYHVKLFLTCASDCTARVYSMLQVSHTETSLMLYRVAHETLTISFSCLQRIYHTHILKISITYLRDSQPAATELFKSPLYRSGTVFCSISHLLRHFLSSAVAWRHTSSNSVTRNCCYRARKMTLSFVDMLITLTYLLTYLKHWSKCSPYAPITEASRFRNSPIAWSVKSVGHVNMFIYDIMNDVTKNI